MKDSEKSRQQLLSELQQLRGQLNSNNHLLNKSIDYKELNEAALKLSRQVVIIIQDNHVVFVDGIIDDLLNIPAAELIDCHIDCLFKSVIPSHIERVKKSYSKYKTNPNYLFSDDILITDGAGKRRWLEVDSRGIIFQGKQSILAMFHDITRRKKAEIDLQENRGRLELSLESAGLAIWDQNFQTGEVIRNHQWAEMLGYSLEEVGSLLDDWKKLIHPDDLPMVIEMAQKHENGEISEFNVEHRMKTKSGEWKWIKNWGKVVERDENGKPLRALGTHLDITASKLNQEIHEKSRKFLKDILQATELDINIRDKDTNILYAGEDYSNYYGNAGKDIIGKNNLELWRSNARTEQQIRKWLDEDHQVLYSDMEYDYEEEIEYSNGNKIWFRTIKKKIITPEGIPAVLVTYEDITSRKLAEQELEENQEKFREIAELAPIGIYETDEKFYITYANKKAFDIFGYTQEDLDRGINCLEMFSGSEKDKAWQNIQRVISGLYPDELHEYIAVHKDGKMLPVELKSSPIIKDKVFCGLRGVISDITSRKETENALKQSEERFKELFMNAPLAYQSMDENMQLIEVNQAWLDTLGYSRDEVIGSSFGKYVAPESLSMLSELLEKFIRDGAIHSTIFKLKDKSGREIAVDYNGKIQYTEDGKFARTHCIFQDITEKLKAQEARLKAEREKEVILNSMSEKLSYYDTEFKVQWMNKAAERSVGKSSDQLIGEYCYKVWDKSDKPCDNCPGKNVLETGEPYEREMTLPNGKHIFLRTCPVRDTNGKIIGLLELGLDITKRKHAEKALVESEKKYRMLFETAHDAIFLIKDGRVEDCNKETLRMFGCTRKQILGHSPLDFSPPKQADGQSSKKSGIEKFKLALNGNPQYFEWRHMKANGEIFEAEISLNKIFYHSYDYVLAIVRDITERKNAEHQIQQSKATLEGILRSAPIGIGLIQRREIIWNNEWFSKMIGYTQAELEGRDTLMLYADIKEYNKISHLSETWSKHESIYTVETKFKCKDGHTIDTLLSASILNHQEKPESFIFTALDITERNHAEQGLKTSHEILSLANKHLMMESLLKEVVNSLKNLTGCEAVAVRLLDKNTPIPYQAYTGFPVELYGRENSLFNYDNNCRCTDVIRNDFDPSKPYHTDIGSFFVNSITEFITIANKNDEEQTCNICNRFGYETVALVPIKVDRKMIGLIHCADSEKNKISLDMVKILEQLAIQLGAIIERVKAGEALRESEERFRNLVESMNDGLLVVDSQIRFTYINQKMADLLKLNPGDVIGQKVEGYLDEKNVQIIKKQWELRKKGGSESYELTWTTADNKKVVTIISPRPIWSSDHQFKGSFSVVTDISERKQDELIEKSKSRLADLLRGSNKIKECLKAGCRAPIEAGLLKHTAFILINDDNKITHLDYHKKGNKDIAVFNERLPEIISKLEQDSEGVTKTSESYLIADKNITLYETVITPLADRIVDHKGWLIAQEPYPGKRIGLRVVMFIEDIAESVTKRINEILFLSHLEYERQQLEEKNIALREVLASIEEEKMEIRHRVAQRIDQMVIPTLNRVVNNDGSINHTYYDLLSTSIRELAASSGGLMHLYSKLSPREVEICNLIKGGSSSKEIAKTLHLSVATIQKHRERIRHKLGLANKNINLASYLKNPS